MKTAKNILPKERYEAIQMVLNRLVIPFTDAMPPPGTEVVVVCSTGCVHNGRFSYGDKAIPEYGHKAGDHVTLGLGWPKHRSKWESLGIVGWIPYPSPTL